MKLLTRTTILYVTITLIVFSLGSVLFYSFLRDLVDEETTESLYLKKQIVLESLREQDSILTNSPLAEDVNIVIVPNSTTELLKDTFIYERHEDELQPYRMLVFPFEKNGTHYRISVRKIMIETDDLVEGIFVAFIIVLGVLAFVIIVAMQLIARKIWKPFFGTIEQMKKFRPGGKNEIALPSTNITEFQELNLAIGGMIANTETAFHSLKSFSENAAHEIQTPLAIITSTTEVLMQDPGLTEEQHRSISNINSTAGKLSNLTSTLLLLTKIENKQFVQDKVIDFSYVVHQKIALLEELFEHKQIVLSKNIKEEIRLKLHPALAEILVSNLLVNALRHTKEGGSVHVVLDNNSFLVSNTGSPIQGNVERLFERFYKEDQSESSTGLGLSLVKMVADSADLKVSYTYFEGKHIFSVQF